VLTAIDRKPGNTYGMPRARKLLHDRGVLQQLVTELNAWIRMPRKVTVTLKSCVGMLPAGQEANAFYNGADHTITMCDELVDFEDLLFRNFTNDVDFAKAVTDATAFFFLHEAGHALINELQIGDFGGEEDAADGIATTFLILTGRERIAAGGADGFRVMAAAQPQGQPMPFWDDHKLDAQRFFDLTCRLYGSDPQRFQGLVTGGFVDPDRAPRCPGEFENNKRAFQRNVGPFLKKQI